MTHAGWLTSSRVLMVAGKGGVGSSTVAAAAALAAARMGADVLFVGVDGRPGMGRLLGGRDLDPTDRVLQRVPGGGQVRGCTVPPDRAFTEYLELKGVGGLLRKAASAASLPMIAAATPGLEYLLVLGAIKEFDRQRRADLIVVDAPPAGHAGPFLASAAALAEAVRSGPVRDQADEVSEMLTDPTRCGTTLVTLPEETPVNEVVELHHQIHDVVGVADRPLIVNGCWPDRPGLSKTPAMAARSHHRKLGPDTRRRLESAAAFGRARLAQQREQLERLADEPGLPVVTLPRLPTAHLDADDLSVLADAIAASAS